MRQLARNGRKSPVVRELALSIVRPLPNKDWAGEVASLHGWVQRNIRYTQDINQIETIQTPERTLNYGQGDCDDHSILLASLLESVGHPARFVAVGKRPGQYGHVFVETPIGPRWVSAETTEPVSLGWVPRSMPYRLERNV